MPIDLFAGIPVTDYATALDWYGRLFGSPPSFLPNDTEAVWELAEHRFVFIEQLPERAGHARHLIFVDNLDDVVAQIAERGLIPGERETYANGVRKVAYRDPDGNEFGFGGALPPAPAT
jgi:predicted enzyme related to lactoylglutathione lyase